MKALFKLVVWLSLLIAALTAVPFVVPWEQYHSQLESLLSDGLGARIRFKAIRYQIWPLPHLEASTVTLITDNGQGAAVIPRVGIWLSPRPLLEGKLEIRRVHFLGLATNEAFIRYAMKNWSEGHSQSPIHIRRVTAANVTVRLEDNTLIGPIGFAGDFSGQRGLRSLTVDLNDEMLRVKVAPDEAPDQVRVEITGKKIQHPLLRNVSFEQIQAQGILSDSSLKMTSVDARLFGGKVQGTVQLDWKSLPARIGGNIAFNFNSTRSLQRRLPTIPLPASAEGNLTWSLLAGDPELMLASLNLEGSLLAKNWAPKENHAVLQIDGLRTQFIASSYDLLLRNTEIAAFRGKMTAALTYLNWQDKWFARSDWQLQSAQIGSALEKLVGFPYVAGEVSGTGRLSIANAQVATMAKLTRVEGQLKGSSVSIQEELPKTSDKKPARRTVLRVDELEFNGHYSQDRVAAESVIMAGYGGTAILKDAALDWRKRVSLVGVLQAKHINLGELLQDLIDQNAVTGMIDTDFRVAASSDTFADVLNNPSVEGVVRIANGKIPRQSTANSQEAANWFQWDEGELHGRLHDGAIGIEKLRLAAYGGELATEQAEFAWTKDWHVRGQIMGTQLQARPLSTDLFGHANASGKLDGRIAVRLAAPHFLDLIERPQAMGTFTMVDGAVFKADLAKASRGSADAHGEGAKTEFSELSGRFVVNDRKFQLSRLKIRSPQLQATGRVVSDEKSRLKGSMHVTFRSTANLVGIPLNVSGTIDEPRFLVSGGAVVGGAVGTTLLGPGLGTVVGIQTGRVFSGIASLFTENKDERIQSSDISDEQFVKLMEQLVAPGSGS